MKPTFTLAALSLTFSCLMCLPTAEAQSTNPLLEHAKQLQATHQAPQFVIGTTTYQVVPDAQVVATPPDATPSNGPASRSLGTHGAPAAQAVGQIGPYSVVLGSTRSGGPQTTRHVNNGTSQAGQPGVVVNLKTGLPSLIHPQLQLHVEQAGRGAALASALGGKLLYDGGTSLLVVIAFDSLDAALQALPQARALDGVTHAQPTLQRRFRKLR